MRRQSDEWQRIDTAPKDGTVILAYCPDDGIVTVQYFTVNKQWGQISDSDRLTAFYPTHWMPLPEPPHA